MKRQDNGISISIMTIITADIMLCMGLACAPTVSSLRVSEGPLSGMEFVTIPEGSFQMGSASSELDRESNEKLHRVTVGSFELMTTEVTQVMWEEVMGSNPSNGNGVGSDLPVFNVSWNDCQEFIGKLNDQDDRYIYRLPTEAEWEYACRAGTITAYFWGSIMNGDYCCYEGNSNNSADPCGGKLPNNWGLYDMSGNVWEWCQDAYTSDYDDCPTDGSAFSHPDPDFVIRGGSWYSGARGCRSAYRGIGSPGFRSNILGFRLARTAR